MSLTGLILKAAKEPIDSGPEYQVGRTVHVCLRVIEDGQTPKYWGGARCTIISRHVVGLVSKRWAYVLRHSNGRTCQFAEDEVELRILHLPLKTRWFNDIKAGTKTEEFRRVTDYWRKRLEGKDYDEIHIKLGYPKRGDESRTIKRKWNGYDRTVRRGWQLPIQSQDLLPDHAAFSVLHSGHAQLAMRALSEEI